MQLSTIIKAIEDYAPLAYQESYDNCGLQVGDRNAFISGALLTLDVTEAVLDEAIANNCNLIVAHHPLIFSGIKSLTGKDFVERIIKKAIKDDINIYAAHTNLDNVRNGVNGLIAQKLGLQSATILSPKGGTLLKLYTYVPKDKAGVVLEALFAAGAGAVGNYAECSFTTEGIGSFKPGATTNPVIGKAGGEREIVEEIRIEVLVPAGIKGRVLKALLAAHPYEEVAHEFIALQNTDQHLGAGMIGSLPEPIVPEDFFVLLKNKMKAEGIRYTPVHKNTVQRIAVCGGSGSFLLKDAITAGADVLVTADFKYHQFFDAEGKIIICDIGHYETEQFTPEIFQALLKKKFPNFATLLSTINTNPIKYYR